MFMLSTIISFSGDDKIIIWVVLLILGGLLMVSGLAGNIKHKKEEEERKSSNNQYQQQPYSPMYPPKEKPKVTKTSDIKCIFCGQTMDETQAFCSACGRRKD